MVSGNTCNWHPGGRSPGVGVGGNHLRGQRRDTSPYLGGANWHLDGHGANTKGRVGRGPGAPAPQTLCRPSFYIQGEEGQGHAAAPAGEVWKEESSRASDKAFVTEPNSLSVSSFCHRDSELTHQKVTWSRVQSPATQAKPSPGRAPGLASQAASPKQQTPGPFLLWPACLPGPKP